MIIRTVTTADSAAIADIYNYYVRDTIFTFEEKEIEVPAIEQRIVAITARYPWLVCEHAGKIAGYAYVGEWKSRVSYRYTLETSIYLAPQFSGKGIGTRLFAELLDAVRQADQYHALIGVISLPNPASVALHEKFGFQKAAHFQEVGYKFNGFIDVGYWHLLL